jgi:fluoride ion exporter CrcB/FEX
LLDSVVPESRQRERLWMTAFINVLGSGLAGVLVTHGAFLHHYRDCATTGLLGGFTTWSGAIVMPYLEWRRGRRALSAAVIFTTATAAIAGFLFGRFV